MIASRSLTSAQPWNTNGGYRDRLAAGLCTMTVESIIVGLMTGARESKILPLFSGRYSRDRFRYGGLLH